MVLQTERYPGGYDPNSYSSYQGPYGSYSNYQAMTEQTTPYPGNPQIISNYQSTHAHQQQSGWSTGGNYSTGGGFGAPVMPSLGGYGNSHGYESSYTHGTSHGFNHGNPSNHGSYGSPHGYGNSHGYENSHGFGSGSATNIFNKLIHGHSSYGNTSSNYGHHSAGGTNQPSWIFKGLDDNE